jgi:hypothetical protein
MRAPHPEERPLGRVSKDENYIGSWFETREDALLTMRVPHPEERPLGRVSKDENYIGSRFETAQKAPPHHEGSSS